MAWKRFINYRAEPKGESPKILKDCKESHAICPKLGP